MQTAVASTLPQLIVQLTENKEFISTLQTRLSLHRDENLSECSSLSSESIKLSPQQIEEAIEQLSEVIMLLIHKKLQVQMQHLIADNNAILQQIKTNIQKSRQSTNISTVQKQRISDASFTEIRNLITEQKRKMLQNLGEQGQIQKSISMLGQYDDFSEKFNELQKKIKSMEEKYQTNFKSLWNVLSMTESAVFDFIKDSNSGKNGKNEKNRDKGEKVEKDQGKEKSIFSFWK